MLQDRLTTGVDTQRRQPLEKQSLVQVFSPLVDDYGMALSACAVWESWSVGRAAVLGVQPDRLDDQVERVNAVDFAARYAGVAWREAKAFGDVEQTIHGLGIAVEHEEHGTNCGVRR